MRNLVRSILPLAALSLPAFAHAQHIVNVPNTPPAQPVPPPPTTVRAEFGEIPTGTQLVARMNNSVATTSQESGPWFSATTVSDVRDVHGRLLIPAGSQISGRVYDTHRSMDDARLSLGIDGISIHGTFVPLSAEITKAQTYTWRAGWRFAQNVRLPAGAPITLQLSRPLPVASLEHALGASMRGGGPK
jgi:hypothetical protein